MVCRRIELMLAALMLANPGLPTDWSGFQRQVSLRKLSPRSVRVALPGGGEIKTTLVQVEDNGLTVKATKAMKQWASGPERAFIPREQVRSVRFGGRIGHRGLIGGLLGLGAGVAVPVGIGASRGYEEVPSGLAAIVLGPALGAVGYLIGRATDKPAPEFVIE